jgi:hypothetical protein
MRGQMRRQMRFHARRQQYRVIIVKIARLNSVR